MPTFTYRRPQLGLNVQGYVAEEIGENERVLLKCLACAGLHLVDPTGAILVGPDDDDEAYHE
jgi:hypothetical protein